jgi:SRSO17 transposase
VGKHLPQQVRSVLRAWLTPLSKPQQHPALLYLVGLLWIIRFRSIREIAARFDSGHSDRLQHFVSCSSLRARNLQHHMQRGLTRQAPGQSHPLLVLDDTPCARNGHAIEGLGLHHSAKGLIRGWCAVTAMLKVGPQRFLWAVRGYRPKKNCPHGQFRSKIELAVEIMHEAAEYFPRGGLTVLMDSWYACARLLTAIQEAGWIYVAAVRSNRLVKPLGRNRNVSVRSLAKSRSDWRTVRAGNRRYRVRRQRAWLPHVGEVLVFVIKSGREVRCFVSNELRLSEAQMVRLYGQRFWIETLHREMKQHLGFGELFVRKWAAAERHWTLVGLAYNLVVLWNKKRRRSFGAMVRAFRDSVCLDQMIQLHKRFVTPQ